MRLDYLTNISDKNKNHPVLITFTLNERHCKELTKLGCHRPLDIIQALCNISTSVANRMITDGTPLSEESDNVHKRLRQDLDSYLGARANAVIDDVLVYHKKKILPEARAEIVRSAMTECGYGEIVEGKKDEQLLNLARPGLTAELNTLADKALSLTSKALNYLNKEIKPLIYDLTYDAIVNHPVIGPRHMQKQAYMPTAQVLDLVRTKTESWVAEEWQLTRL
ncbi:peptide transporter [Edwardsiella ictaluri]|uniref:peptide transporter n=1 Tax=Edwardsiella ictaluri TaxID=67780 RepID=UPI0024168CFD|nr:peptide transporter [Edwardsiella ictaluri]WFO12580.1 peptide transporter [Edwardsiella ictaluri]